MNLSLAPSAHRFSRRKLHCVRTAFLSALLPMLIFAASSANAQQDRNPSPPHSSIPGMVPAIGSRQQQDPALQSMLQRMARERNDERQKQIVADSARLLKLAKQLNAAVAKSNENTLSIPVVKDAAEIEKLAKAIREKMSNGD